VTAWGVVPARGRLCYCGTCGAVIAFGEKLRRGPAANAEAARVTLAVQGHLRESARCAKGGTFNGGEITACRCSRSVLVNREDGLYCARCEGLVAPQVAPALKSRGPAGGAS
jgi:hypothetical protein